MAFTLFYVTFPNKEKANEIAHQLMEERTIACANIFPIESAYWWNNAQQQEGEWVGILKTSTMKKQKTIDRLEDLHPYEVPCIISMAVEANDSYEKWIEDSVR